MDADYYVRTPTLKKLFNVADRAIVEELSGFWTKAIDCPVNIFHPVLLAAQKPVIYANELCRNTVRFFDCTHNAHGI